MKNTIIFCLLAAFLGMTACRKSSSKSATPAPLSWTQGVDIYMVGLDSGRAVYWKNGVETVLGVGEGYGISVAGEDIYVGGIAFKVGANSTTELAAYWKNGVEHDLIGTGNGAAYAPRVVGSDVYLPGSVSGPGAQQSSAVYWKNDQMFNLDPSPQGSAESMVIQGPDVYVLGSVNGQADTTMVWKNGQRLQNFFNLDTHPFSQFLTSGNNIYIVGDQGYYINFSQYEQLQDAGAGASPVTFAMYINGSDVYLAGAVDSAGRRLAAYWKNGVRVALPNYDGTATSAATGVVVAGNDVYAIGSTNDISNGYEGVYWKNGKEAVLSKQGAMFGVVGH